MRIVVLEGDSVGRDISWAVLQQYGELEVCPVLRQEEVRSKIADADIIIPNKLRIDASVLEGSRVKLICEAATGYNNIDIEYCKKQGIAVTNVRNYSTDSVAQHTFALLFAVSERLSYYDQFVKSGCYAASNSFSHLAKGFCELAGKTYGIVGLGNIGRRVAELATAFGCRVIYYSASGNHYDVPYEQVDFEVLLKESDVISVHCPLTERTRYLFTYDAFCRMKKDALFVNVARGPIVCEADLAKALNEELIAGAALDVFEAEPIAADNPLLQVTKKEQLVMTPHIGWGSIEARNRLIADIADSIESYLAGKPMKSALT